MFTNQVKAIMNGEQCDDAMVRDAYVRCQEYVQCKKTFIEKARKMNIKEPHVLKCIEDIERNIDICTEFLVWYENMSCEEC